MQKKKKKKFETSCTLRWNIVLHSNWQVICVFISLLFVPFSTYAWSKSMQKLTTTLLLRCGMCVDSLLTALSCPVLRVYCPCRVEWHYHSSLLFIQSKYRLLFLNQILFNVSSVLCRDSSHLIDSLETGHCFRVTQQYLYILNCHP